MLNPHPPLSAFPAVILTLIVFFELVSIFQHDPFYRRAVRLLLCILIIISPLTYFSGYFGAEAALAIREIPQKIIERHQLTAKIYLFALIPCVIAHFAEDECKSPRSRKYTTWFFRICLLLAYAIILLTSFRGGELVFTHGAGVK